MGLVDEMATTYIEDNRAKCGRLTNERLKKGLAQDRVIGNIMLLLAITFFVLGISVTWKFLFLVPLAWFFSFAVQVAQEVAVRLLEERGA